MKVMMISCDNCAVVLDANKIDFPDNFINDDGSVNEEFAMWNGHDFIPKTKCPLCGSDIEIQD